MSLLAFPIYPTFVLVNQHRSYITSKNTRLRENFSILTSNFQLWITIQNTPNGQKNHSN